jgi:hypothetical protein
VGLLVARNAARRWASPSGPGRSSLASARTFSFWRTTMNVETKAVGYAIYDCPTKLKAFLLARESGNASKELLAQLSADAMAEQEADRSKIPRATLIDFQRARRERAEPK